jgi:NAD(P)-dependent dehydrogenase (short-subunit alcohol dehydrogenase family)
MSKTIIVVGASRGIGLELVKRFAQDDSATIIALARNINKMKEDYKPYSNVKPFHLDLSSETVRKDLTSILDDYSSIDVMINNAGYLVNKPFLEISREDFKDSYNANAIGVMQSVQAALPKMKKNGAHVVSISTMGAFQGSAKFPGLAAYSTSKTAVVTMTELLSEEYKDDNIQFNCLCLGAVQTEMLEEAFPGYEAPLSADHMATYIYEFAMSANKFMNGKIIPLSLSTP